MVSVFKASNIKISVLVVLCCTAGKLVLPLAVVYIDAAFSVPPLVFVAAATAPPLVIGARTRRPPDKAETSQKPVRNMSETGETRQLTYTSSFERPPFSQPMSPKPNGKATSSIPIFYASRPDMAMKPPPLLLLLLGSFLLSLLFVSAVDVSDRFRTVGSYFSFNLGPRPSLAKGCSNLVVLRPVVGFGESFEAYGINGFSVQGKQHKNISFGGVVLHRREVSTASSSCITVPLPLLPFFVLSLLPQPLRFSLVPGQEISPLSFFSEQCRRNQMAKLRVPFQFLMLPHQTWLWNCCCCAYYPYGLSCSLSFLSRPLMFGTVSGPQGLILVSI